MKNLQIAINTRFVWNYWSVGKLWKKEKTITNTNEREFQKYKKTFILSIVNLLLLGKYSGGTKYFKKVIRRDLPMQVTSVRKYHTSDTYVLCPNCNTPMDREYVNFCSYCGQRLSWKEFQKGKSQIITVPLNSQEGRWKHGTIYE